MHIWSQTSVERMEEFMKMGSALFIETYSNETCEEWEKIELGKFTYSVLADDVHFVCLYYEFDPIERRFLANHFLVLNAPQP